MGAGRPAVEGARDGVGRRSRLLVVLAALVVVLAVAGHAAGLRLNANLHRVQPPATTASPDEVVSTYVAAYNARDFQTMGTLYPGSSLPRFEVLGTIRHLRITDSRPVPGAEDGNPVIPGRRYHRVRVTLDYTGLRHSNLAYDEGPNGWAYLLARDSDTAPWRIVDQGNP